MDSSSMLDAPVPKSDKWRTTLGSQIRANFMKSCSLNLKNRKLIFCQSVLSIIILVIAVSLSLTIGRQFEAPITTNGTVSYAATIRIRAPGSGSSFSSTSIYQLPFEYLKRAGYSSSGTGNNRKYAFLDDTRGGEGIPVGNSINIGDENRNRVYDSLMSRVAQFVISPFSQFGSTLYNISYLPIMEKVSGSLKSAISTQTTAYFETCRCLGSSPRSQCYATVCSGDKSLVPRVGITIQEATSQRLRYSVMPVRLADGSFSSESLLPFMEVAQALNSAAYRIATNYTFPAANPTCILNTSINGNSDALFDNSAPCDIQSIMPSSGEYLADVNTRFTPLIELSALVLSLMLPLPLFMYRIVAERQSGMSSMIYQNGMRPFGYWFSNFLADFVLFYIVLIPVIVVGAAVSFVIVVKPTAAFYFTLFATPFGLIPTAYFFAIFFSSPARSIVFAYIWTFITFGVAWVLNAIVMNPSIATPVWYLIYPPWILFRASWFTLFANYFPTLVNQSTIINETVNDTLGMIGFGMVMMLLVVWLDSFMPKKGSGIRSPFTICCQCGAGRSKRFRQEVSDNDLSSRELDSLAGSKEDVESARSLLAEDQEVQRERQLVNSGSYPDDSPVVVVNVTKIWPGEDKQVALDKICIHLEKDSVFGLLGPNGAGKSTLIKIMTGEEVSTKGRVFIGGVDVSASPESTSSMIGLCPQFDTHWDDLTVEEHLLFYVRLKGVPKSYERARVKKLITDVGLEGEVNRLASALSGGQKRRLSIGIALAGEPNVVFLDEPSTGLDPATRRGLWDTLNTLRQGRCFLLTTHLMEEAEVLCNRIGILSRGKMKCLGDKQRLKALYGTGYKIDISADSSNHERIHKYITAIAPSAVLVTKNPVSLVYRVQDIVLSEIFGEVERSKARYGIRNWALSQSSLDDVFVRIVKDDEHLEDEIPAPPVSNSPSA